MDNTLTLQDVVKFLKEHMHVDVSVSPVPYDDGWTNIQVNVRLGDEVIASGSDTYRT